MKNMIAAVKNPIEGPMSKMARADEQINLKKELRDFCKTSHKKTTI